MRRLIGFALGALLLGGCAVYAEPVPPPAGAYVEPPPVVVAPGPRVWWGWHGGWYRGWHDHWALTQTRRRPESVSHAGRLSPGGRNCRTVSASTVDVSQSQGADCAGSRNQPPAGGVEDEPGWVSIGSSAFRANEPRPRKEPDRRFKSIRPTVVDREPKPV
jgi:hypothetical protein